jgi:MinD superfamily P-loop ATPase
VKEIVIISGKGGTGKTSLTASFAALTDSKMVLADCDVDAADLHLVMKPRIQARSEFRSGRKAAIRPRDCTGCGRCIDLCRFGAVKHSPAPDVTAASRFAVDEVSCEGCGVCVRFCPANAINFDEQVCGEWFVSETRFGSMVHARLGVAAENSGKLVTLVRGEAKMLAGRQGADFVLVDGSPGIGCPVIASLTAADLALIVTEPTVSGDHDLRRIAGLTKQLGVPATVCVNKHDINPSATEKIRTYARSQGLAFAGCIRYDKAITVAQREEKAVTEYCAGGIASDICDVWNAVRDSLDSCDRDCPPHQ